MSARSSAPLPTGTRYSATATDRVLPALVACTVAAAMLRLSTLHLQSYWYDEAVTVDVVRRSFGGMLSGILHGESTPPLYYVLAWAWSKVFGTGETGLRSLSAVLGTATVPVAYAAARTFVRPRSSLVAAALVAVSPFLVWFSQEARAYALLVLLAAGSLACLRRPPAIWAAVAGLALTAHYFAVFLVGAEAVWLLRSSSNRRSAQRAVAAVAAVACVLVPLAVYQAHHAKHTEWIGNSGGVTGRVAYLLHQLVVGEYPATHIRPLIVAVAVVVAAGVFAWTERADRRGAVTALVFGLAAIAVPLALAAVGELLAGGRGDYFIYRNLITVAIPLTIAAGAVLQRAGVVAVVITCALLAAVSIDIARRPELQRPDVRSVAAAIGTPEAGRLIAADTRTATVLKVYLAVVEPSPDSQVSASGIDIIVDPGVSAVVDSPPGFRRVGLAEVNAFTIIHLRVSRTETLRPRNVERQLRAGFEVAILAGKAGVDRSATRPAATPPARARA